MPYTPRLEARSDFIALRHCRYHCLQWGDARKRCDKRPTLVLLHGWMDVAASYQFLVDALPGPRHVLAADWRGFGLSTAPQTDSYWFSDCIGDLDALLDAISPDAPVDLLGHSMGGNVVMAYAGARPQRVRRLINLEGFGMPRTVARQAPARLAQWLDELKQPQQLKPYASLEAVAKRLQQNNPLLSEDKAAWLAGHWAAQQPDGAWHLLADAAHKRVSPVLYRVEEHLALWAAIQAPLLWVEGDRSDTRQWWGRRYGKPEFHERLNSVRQVRRETLSPAGHMLHHDQPEALARLIEDFLA
jgi:pimeloyl-ACP methyl ester carboxylesterase